MRGTYSQLTDEELDNLVVAIKIKSNQRMLYLSSLGLSIISVKRKFISNRDLHTHHLLFIISDAAYTRDDFQIFDYQIRSGIVKKKKIQFFSAGGDSLI